MLILAVAISAAAVIAASPSPGPPPAAVPATAARAPSAASPRPAASPSPVPRGPVVIEGTVRGPDGKPAANALVIARDEQAPFPRPPATARAGATGQFRLTVPPAVSYIVRVESAGLAARTIRHVRPGSPLAVILARGATIEGVVRETGGGTPVNGATVEAREEMRSTGPVPGEPDSGVVRATTDARGRFRLDGLAPGLHTLTAFARGVGRAEQRSVSTGRPVDLNLVPGGSVAGAVTDAKGKPVEGAVVRALSTLPMGSRATLLARTDPSGAFAIHGVPPGQYRVLGTHPELAPAVVESIAVERDAEARADLVLPSFVTVRGRLVGAGEKPTRGSIALRETAGEPLPPVIAGDLVAEAGEDGVFRLRAGPGSHVIEAVAPGLASRRVEVDVPAGAEAIDIGNVALEVGIAIRGRVRDAAGQAVERASLFTYSQEAARSYSAQSEADGTYVLAGLPPGMYSVSATAAGMGRAERKAEAGASGIDFVLQPAGTITGTVVDEAGKPVAAFRVFARAPMRSGAMGGGQADSFGVPDGRFVLEDVADGEYVVDVSAPDRAPAVVSGVKVTAGGITDVGTVRLTGGGTIKGVVVDAASAPVSGATVWVSGPGQDYSRIVPEVTTDSGGAFEVRGVPAGSAQVRVTHSAYAQGLVMGVEVDPARGPADVRVVLMQGGRIEGRVRSRDGSLPPGAVVTARPLRPGTPWFSPTGPGLQPLAGDGSFVLEHVPAGPVSVSLMTGQAGRYTGAKEVQAEVREAETTTVEIILRSIAVTGKITRGGSPLAGLRVEFMSPNSMRMMVASGGGPSALPPNAAITREDGSYDLTVSEPGETRVDIQTADRQGRLPAPRVQVPDAESYVADFNFTGGFIEGVVVDRDTDQPIPAASVGAALTERTPGSGFSSATASGEGRFRLELEPGEYRVTARAEGYGSDNVTLTVGDSGASGVRLALARGLTIKGRVVDTAGRGVGGLMVSGLTGEGRTRSGGGGHTLSDGSFEIAGLIESPYVLTSQTQGGLFAMATGVVPGEGAVTLTLRPGGRVSIKVLGTDGAPAQGIGVSVTRVQGIDVGGLGYGRTDASGQAEMLVPAGTLEITTRTADKEGKATVTVASGAAASAELTLKPAGSR
jgi:protocatechuate 3,4-dioxygenase beta subunit